jgi:hypothetical protein
MSAYMNATPIGEYGDRSGMTGGCSLISGLLTAGLSAPLGLDELRRRRPHLLIGLSRPRTHSGLLLLGPTCFAITSASLAQPGWLCSSG